LLNDLVALKVQIYMAMAKEKKATHCNEFNIDTASFTFTQVDENKKCRQVARAVCSIKVCSLKSINDTESCRKIISKQCLECVLLICRECREWR
jgi:hypothetical protein